MGGGGGHERESERKIMESTDLHEAEFDRLQERLLD